jgi:hypothetical protein
MLSLSLSDIETLNKYAVGKTNDKNNRSVVTSKWPPNQHILDDSPQVDHVNMYKRKLSRVVLCQKNLLTSPKPCQQVSLCPLYA